MVKELGGLSRLEGKNATVIVSITTTDSSEASDLLTSKMNEEAMSQPNAGSILFGELSSKGLIKEMKFAVVEDGATESDTKTDIFQEKVESADLLEMAVRLKWSFELRFFTPVYGTSQRGK